MAMDATEVSRLGEVIAQVAQRFDCQVSDVLSQLSQHVNDDQPSPDLYEMARSEKRFRLLRNEHFGVAMFRDPAWDMLLDLMIAEGEGKRLSVSALCLGSGVAATTALRHLDRLIRHGFVTREDDLADGRRVFVDLVPAQRDRLMALLADWSQSGSIAAAPRSAKPDRAAAARRASPPAAHPVFLS